MCRKCYAKSDKISCYKAQVVECMVKSNLYDMLKTTDIAIHVQNATRQYNELPLIASAADAIAC